METSDLNDMSNIYEQYMNRSQVYGGSLDGLDVNVPAIEAGICKDPTKCSHPYLNKWDREYLCMDCWEKLNTYNAGVCIIKPDYAERIAQEEELENDTPVDKISEGLSEKEMNDVIGKNSSMRGVKIGFLLEFTKKYNCWAWTSWDVIRKIVKPQTADGRYRYVDLEEMKDHIGQASTFISYAQAGAWGDLVAALLDGGADLERCVWLDVFAIRQWPSSSPDLDFASTIAHCKSFMVVCSSLKEVEEMHIFDMLENIFGSMFEVDL